MTCVLVTFWSRSPSPVVRLLITGLHLLERFIFFFLPEELIFKSYLLGAYYSECVNEWRTVCQLTGVDDVTDSPEKEEVGKKKMARFVLRTDRRFVLHYIFSLIKLASSANKQLQLNWFLIKWPQWHT